MSVNNVVSALQNLIYSSVVTQYFLARDSYMVNLFDVVSFFITSDTNAP